jgi:hypothetical protein
VSVPALFAGVGSTIPAAGAAVAVLATVPVAEALIAATTVKVAVVPTGRLTVVLMEPLPDAAVQPAPALGLHVQEVNEAAAGWGSVTSVAGAAEGPVLATVTVYVVDWPGTTDATPSVLVTARSVRGVSVSTSVAVLLPALVSVTPNGTVTLAVFVNVPVAAGAIAALTENVTDAPTGRPTLLLIEPLPDAGQVPPPDPEHVHVIALTPAGIVSVTDAPVTADGPVLETTTV